LRDLTGPTGPLALTLPRATLFAPSGAREWDVIVLTLFESLDAVQALLGENYEVAVLLPGARELLSRFDERCVHYEVVVEPK
jgi:hypothetical protein